MDDLNFNKIVTPLSEKVSDEDARKTDELLQELVPIFQKYGIDGFAVTTCTIKPVGPDLIVGALSAHNPMMATQLLFRTQKSVQEYCALFSSPGSRPDPQS